MAVKTEPLTEILDRYDIHIPHTVLWVAHIDANSLYDIENETYRFLVVGSTETSCLETANKIIPASVLEQKIECVPMPSIHVLHSHRLLNLDGKRVSVGSAHHVIPTALSQVTSPGGVIYPSLDNFVYCCIRATERGVAVMMGNIDDESGVLAHRSPTDAFAELEEENMQETYVIALPIAQLMSHKDKKFRFKNKWWDGDSLLKECLALEVKFGGDRDED